MMNLQSKLVITMDLGEAAFNRYIEIIVVERLSIWLRALRSYYEITPNTSLFKVLKIPHINNLLIPLNLSNCL